MKWFLNIAFASVACYLVGGAPIAMAQQAPSVNQMKNAMARLLWQDAHAPELTWSNVANVNSQWVLEPQKLSGMPVIEPGVSWVQMEAINDVVVVGAHDDNEGRTQSGWIAIQSGVYEEEHGDHSHTRFDKPPRIVQSVLNSEQGNPAHVYRYGSRIFLANDKKNGFTVLSRTATPSQPGASIRSQFYPGGGNHITLAATSSNFVFATWADREGDNQGRVDVVALENATATPMRSFKLPSGGLHGATSVGNKVFFAPADGVCCLRADIKTAIRESDIQHLSLGTDSSTNKPLRTGAFAVSDDYAVFTSGSGPNASLHLVDSRSEKPSLQTIALPVTQGLNVMTPKCFKGFDRKPMALCFAERRGSDAQESLMLIALDPNGDKNYSDAKLVASHNIGPSKIEGHSGYHDVAFSRNGKYAYITIPADGEIWVWNMMTLSVDNKVKVGGVPSRIISL
jgi:hypothetical protein